MKKSKVIIPAMALLLFSTAASITGTVAWFSSTRVFNTSAANFGINTVDGNLEAELEARVGTALDGTNNDKIKSDTNCRLYHGSFNALTSGSNLNKAFILNQEPNGTGDDKYVDLGLESTAFTAESATPGDSKWHVRTASETVSDVTTEYKYYVAFSWKITFTYSLASGETKYGLFLDLNASSFAANDTNPIIRSAEVASMDGENPVYYQEKTQIGMRIAFIPAGESAKVFGNNPGPANPSATPDPLDHDITKLGYVNGEGDDNVGHYAEGNYLVHDGSYKRHVNYNDTPSSSTGTAASASDADCLYATTDTSKEVICVAWYEGEDANVISRAQMDNVKASLSFYVRAVDPS